MDYSKYGFRKDFDWDNRFDLKTKVKYKGETYTVSTVDLGLDHSFGIGQPLYYETMIFKNANTTAERWGKYNPFSYFQERYSTEKEARKRHKEIVEMFKNKKVEELIND